MGDRHKAVSFIKSSYRRTFMTKVFSQKEKTKFRNSYVFKKFKAFLKKRSKKLDEITELPLMKGSTVHHLDTTNENYKDLSNDENFIILNKSTHTFLHWLYPIYKKNPMVLENLKRFLLIMKDLENKSKYMENKCVKN